MSLLWQNGDSKAAWITIEQARSRAFLTSLGETALAPPKKLGSEWLINEQQALIRLRAIRVSMKENLPEEQAKLLETWLNTKKELEHLWKDAYTVAPEYIALRQGSPIKTDELRICLNN